MRFLDLGPLQVQVGATAGGPGGRRPGRVLAALLLHVNERVAVSRLLDAVWGDDIQPGSASTLETHIWRLRQLLEPGRDRGARPQVLVSDSGGYRLIASTDQVDSVRFSQLALDVVDLLATGQAAGALQSADRALGLWRGDPFPELAERSWAAGSIARLQEIRTQLQERRIDALLATGRSDAAVSDLEVLLAEHPFRERLWWQRMLALHRSGRSEAATATYRLARRTLIDAVGLEPGPELGDLQQRILAHDPALLGPSATGHAVSSRPVQIRLPSVRGLIGRTADLERLDRLLGEHPVITLTGPAGGGKTALAVAAAHANAGRFPDGVVFVDLTATTPSSDVAMEVAAAVGVSVPAATTPLEALTGYAEDRKVLIVLDNCEQVLDQCAELVAELTGRACRFRFLATSREPLDVEGERVEHVGPVPDPAELFLVRAGLARESLERQQVDAVERICESVDGLALAVELAAAMASTYSLHEIAALVASDPGQLAVIGRGGPGQHRTVDASIDRSYLLMSPDDQAVHRRVSVLPGDFSVDLAQAVMGPDLATAAAPALARLAHRSMLTSVSNRLGQTRFRQLAPIRAHARRRLVQADELDRAERLRDEWIHDLARSRPGMGQGGEAAWYAAITADLPTVRATLHRRLIVERDTLGLQVFWELTGFWYYSHLLDEGCRWADVVASGESWAPAAGVAADQLVSLTAASLYLLIGRTDQARAAVERALAELEPAPAGAVGFARRGSAEPLLPRDQVTLRDHLLMLIACFSLAWDAATMRDLIALVEQRGYLIDPQVGLILGASRVLADMIDGQSPSAILERAERVYADAHAGGNHLAMSLAAGSPAVLALAQRDPRLGRRWSRRVIDAQAQLGAVGVTHQVETFGDVLALDGHLVEATRIFSATRHAAWRVGLAWPRNPETSDLLDRCRDELSVEEFDRAWAIGPTLSREELTRDPEEATQW